MEAHFRVFPAYNYYDVIEYSAFTRSLQCEDCWSGSSRVSVWYPFIYASLFRTPTRWTLTSFFTQLFQYSLIRWILTLYLLLFFFSIRKTKHNFFSGWHQNEPLNLGLLRVSPRPLGPSLRWERRSITYIELLQCTGSIPQLSILWFIPSSYGSLSDVLASLYSYSERNLFSLPAPKMPRFELAPDLFSHAVSIAVVSYVITISMGKLFARKHKYQINNDQVRQQFYWVDADRWWNKYSPILGNARPWSCRLFLIIFLCVSYRNIIISESD